MQVTVGLIGLGNIVGHHLAGLEANAGLRVVAVCDRDEQKARRLARELDVKHLADHRELLSERPDVVVVALPHALHCPVTVEALEAGCHVLVEKPMAVSVAQCNQMLLAAAECKRHLIVTDGSDYDAGAILTGRRFKSGKLGRFFTGSVINERFYFHEGRPHWFLDPAVSGGGMFANVGVHRLAMTRTALLGLTPRRVSASVSCVPEHQVEACTSAIVTYGEGGSMFYEEVGYYPRPEWLNAGKHFVFEEGIVTWDDTAWRIVGRDGSHVEEPLPPRDGPYAPAYANMLRAIRGEQYRPKARENALDVAVSQAAYASARAGHEIDLSTPEWRIAGEAADGAA